MNFGGTQFISWQSGRIPECPDPLLWKLVILWQIKASPLSSLPRGCVAASKRPGASRALS